MTPQGTNLRTRSLHKHSDMAILSFASPSFDAYYNSLFNFLSDWK